MSTLLELENQNRIFSIDPALSFREYEARRLWILPEAKKWIEEQLSQAVSAWNIEENPEEQLDGLVYKFCSGRQLAVGTQFKCLRHVQDGIWELKTADVRLFGWFYKKDCFVISDIQETYKVKGTVSGTALYSGYRDQAIRRRVALDLDEPKFIPGDNPDDVISDWN